MRSGTADRSWDFLSSPFLGGSLAWAFNASKVTNKNTNFMSSSQFSF
jgi:hypothetical protein